jgi:hypothetical protein
LYSSDNITSPLRTSTLFILLFDLLYKGEDRELARN